MSSSQQQQSKKSAKYASPHAWAVEMKSRQMSQLTDEDRARILREAEEARAQVERLAACRKVAARSKKVAETSASTWSVQREMKSRRCDEESLSAHTRAVQQEAEDEDAEMDSMPAYMVAQAVMMPRLVSAPSAGATRAQASALVTLTDATSVAPVTAGAVDERQKALAELRVEPRSDGECAAKFQVFERFSGKVDELRKALVGLAATTAPLLPSAPRQAMERDVKKLDDRENCQIPDQSANWFVHDMTKQLFVNIDKIQDISSGIERKVTLLRAQSNCPICLETFLTPEEAAAAAAAGDDEEDLVLPRVLQCCHSVCEPCWKQWVELKGPSNAFCPLCKNREFLEDISRR